MPQSVLLTNCLLFQTPNTNHSLSAGREGGSVTGTGARSLPGSAGLIDLIGQRSSGQGTDGQETDGQETDGQETDGQETDRQSFVYNEDTRRCVRKRMDNRA